MATSLNAIVIRHERRVRLLFSRPLAIGAFTSTAFYTVTNQDGSGTSPGVQKAMVVADSSHVVELQLDSDLTQGGVYLFSAVAVPGNDATVTPDPSGLFATFGVQKQALLQSAGGVPDIYALLFGKDILFNGGDFVEDHTGDLAANDGLDCFVADMNNIAISDGLPWAPAHGVHARQYVDGARGALPGLRGAAEAAFLADDRVSVAKVVAVDQTPTDLPSDALIMIDLKPVGPKGYTGTLVQIVVPVPVSG